eukprot:scaffold5744_cov159-Amphora_coffeaeformis.AAC.2
MGNDASKQAADVRYLSERVPFEEEEVQRLLLCFAASHDTNDEHDRDSSRLVQWSKHMKVKKHPEKEKEYLSLLAQVEEHILPPDFGMKLRLLLKLPPPQARRGEEWNKMDDWTRREKLEMYLEALANGCGRRGSRAALGTLFQLCAPDGTTVHNSKDLSDVHGHEIKGNVAQVLDLAFRLALATEILRSGERTVRQNRTFSRFEPLAKSCINYVRGQRLRRSVDISVDIDDIDLEKGCCSKMDFIEWSEATVPMLASVLPTFQHMIYFPDQAPPLTIQSFQFPKLSETSSFWDNDDDVVAPVLFSFGCMAKSLGGEVRIMIHCMRVVRTPSAYHYPFSETQWHRLYTSCSDGLSYNGLQNALRGYSGPTLMVIRASDSGSIFGAFTASPWKESKDYYGTDDCFLYQISPEMTVCRPSGRGQNYMFCRSSSLGGGGGGVQVSRMGGSSQAPQGIGFGGSSNRSPRLFLDQSFCGCFVSSQDTTFEKGYLLPRTDAYSEKTFFSADQIEVWGCGGDDVVAAALCARQQDRSMRESYLNQARMVDKAAFVSDFRTGLIESKAFGHMDDIRDSTRNTLLNRTQGKQGYH